MALDVTSSSTDASYNKFRKAVEAQFLHRLTLHENASQSMREWLLENKIASGNTAKLIHDLLKTAFHHTQTTTYTQSSKDTPLPRDLPQRASNGTKSKQQNKGPFFAIILPKLRKRANDLLLQDRSETGSSPNSEYSDHDTQDCSASVDVGDPNIVTIVRAAVEAVFGPDVNKVREGQTMSDVDSVILHMMVETPKGRARLKRMDTVVDHMDKASTQMEKDQIKQFRDAYLDELGNFSKVHKTFDTMKPVGMSLELITSVERGLEEVKKRMEELRALLEYFENTRRSATMGK